MGVLLIIAAIAASVSVGVFAERQRPQAAAQAARRALTVMLYGLVPPVIFFNWRQPRSTSNTGPGSGSA